MADRSPLTADRFPLSAHLPECGQRQAQGMAQDKPFDRLRASLQPQQGNPQAAEGQGAAGQGVGVALQVT